MSSALFASNTQTRSRNLVEFKAGKMTLKGKMVHPDKRKGLIYVYQSDDSLMHFCWKDRSTGIVEDDLMIFPDDIETKKIAQCTTGRAYLMRFKSSNKKFFFWMQETDTEKDDKLWKKLNDSLNNPPPPGSSGSSAGSGLGDRGASGAGGLSSAFGDFGGLGSADLQSILGSMNEQQLQMFLGGLMPVNSPSSNRSASSSTTSSQASRAPSTLPGSRTDPVSTTAAATAGSAASSTASTAQASATSVTSGDKKDEAGASGKIQLSDLQSILGNLKPGDLTDKPDIDLSEVVSMDVMAPILANESVRARLMEHLPESEILPKTEHELKTTMTTPQFKKAMSSFSHALQSGQLGPIMKQFDLPAEVAAAASQGNLEAFAKAMEQYAQSKKDKKKDDDDKMES